MLCRVCSILACVVVLGTRIHHKKSMVSPVKSSPLRKFCNDFAVHTLNLLARRLPRLLYYKISLMCSSCSDLVETCCILKLILYLIPTKHPTRQVYHNGSSYLVSRVANSFGNGTDHTIIAGTSKLAVSLSLRACSYGNW